MTTDMSKLVPSGEQLAEQIITIVQDAAVKYSTILIRMAVSKRQRNIENKLHIDNFLSEVDLELHIAYRERLARVIPSFIYASEEEEPHCYPPGIKGTPDYVAIVDPLDTSELAVRALCGYTHIMIYSLSEQCPLVSVVGDLFHEIRVFCAYRNQNGSNSAFLITRSGDRYQIQPSSEHELCRSLVTAYSMRPLERFAQIAEQKTLLNKLAGTDSSENTMGRIGLDFGSIGLCHVAAGFTNAMIETVKGFALWDLFPGQYILHAAGGTTASLDGTELPLNLNLHDVSDVKNAMEVRQRFIAAGNRELLDSIVTCIV